MTNKERLIEESQQEIDDMEEIINKLNQFQSSAMSSEEPYEIERLMTMIISYSDMLITSAKKVKYLERQIRSVEK